MENKTKATLEVCKEHTMTAAYEDRILLLTPRANNFARIRLGNTYGIDTTYYMQFGYDGFIKLDEVELDDSDEEEEEYE